MAKLRRLDQEINLVQLPQGFQIAVPRWMLDPLTCSQLPQETKPRVALAALARLAELRSTPGLSVGSAAARSDSSTLTKGPHESRKNQALPSTSVAAVPAHALAPVSRTDSSALPSAAEPTAAPSGAESSDPKERR